MSPFTLARRHFKVPIWLLRQYNPDLNFDSVKIGVSVTVPKLEPIEDPSPAATTTASAEKQSVPLNLIEKHKPN